jgi:hypothetical protein
MNYPLFERQIALLDPLAFFKHNLVLVTAMGDSTSMKDLLQAAHDGGGKRLHGLY